MSLEDSFDRLAKAMDKYADVIERFGLKIESEAKAAGEKSADKPAEEKKAGRPKGSTKPKPAPVEEEEEVEDDGLGGDEAEEEEEEGIDADTVKAKLKELGDATERTVASAIFRDMGFKSFNDIPDGKLQAVYDAAVKALKKAKK